MLVNTIDSVHKILIPIGLKIVALLNAIPLLFSHCSTKQFHVVVADSDFDCLFHSSELFSVSIFRLLGQPIFGDTRCRVLRTTAEYRGYRLSTYSRYALRDSQTDTRILLWSTC